MRGRALAFALAVAAGAAVEIAVTLATGYREAWDSPAYWLAGYPALILAAALLGWRWPADAWRLGFLVAIAQMLTMLARTGGGSLWPLALIAGGALGLPCAIAARLAARLRGPDATSTP